ncbi:phage protein [Grimontia kaedaensis]|uniref:Phage protein n=1 Tax=Grimontia kaedaensis TaxID=2872157 RepID=A0ABY4X339_9GAMM|nr:DUF3653 domain-containing protein [Grimontia kaedaensis]USH05592.1 phage protein [Grimontia kaedaensis]
MLIHSFRHFYWQNFNSLDEGAAYFHVKPITVKRWLDGTIPPNAMAEKLLIIRARGYLPNDLNWQGFKVNEQRSVIITPEGREFAPRELEAFPLWRDQYYALKARLRRRCSWSDSFPSSNAYRL